MAQGAEIYFYVDSDFQGNLDRIILPLKNRGHRVLVGRDFDELLLLLEISDPSLVFCAFSSAEETLGPGFRNLTKKALIHKIPILVLGADDPCDGWTVYAPGDGTYETSHLSFTMTAEFVGSYAEPDGESEAEEGELSGIASLPQLSFDAAESGELRAAEILSGTDDLWGDSEVGEESETLIDAVKLFTPQAETSPERTHRAQTVATIGDEQSQMYRDEVSGPIALPPDDQQMEKSRNDKLISSTAFHIALALGAILCVFVAVLFALQPVSKLPQKLQPNVSPGPALARGPARLPGGGDQLEAQSGAGGDSSESPREREGENPTADKRPLSQQDEEPVPLWPTDRLESALPFPGTFRTNSAKFWFQQEWEINRFLDMLRNLPKNTRIRVIGFATEEEKEGGSEELERSRAWAVERFLLREGIPLERLSVARGGVFRHKSDLDEQGRPRSRFVEIIVEPFE